MNNENLPPNLWALNRAQEAVQNMYVIRGFLPLKSDIVLEILRHMERQIQDSIQLVEGDPNAPWDYK